MKSTRFSQKLWKVRQPSWQNEKTRLGLRSVLQTKNKFESRPNVIDSANLYVDKARGESDCLNVVECKICGYA